MYEDKEQLIKDFLDWAIEEEYKISFDKMMHAMKNDSMLYFMDNGVQIINHKDFYVQ